MIEWCTLLGHTRIGQRTTKKRDEIVDLLCGEIQLPDLEVNVSAHCVAEIATAIIELHHLANGALPTVVEIRCCQLEIAQTRYLEGAVGDRPFTNGNGWVSDIRNRIRQ